MLLRATGFDVYAKSACLCLGALLATLALDRQLIPWVHVPELRLASAFSIVEVAAMIAVAAHLLLKRSYARYYNDICDQLRPAIQENVMALALEGRAWPTRMPLHGPARHVLEQCLAVALSGLRGSGRECISKFALERGFVKQWRKAFQSRSVDERKRAISLLALVSGVESDALMRAAMHDRQPAIRTEAARALLAAGDPGVVDGIFRSVLSESLLMRVLLSGDLKRHARYLLANSVPEVLAENRQQETVNCLELLTSWKLAMPGFNIGPLLNEARSLDQGCYQLVLPLLLSLLPYVSVEDSIEDQLLSALDTSDLEIQCAAARAAGRLRLNGLMPSLVRLLNQNARLASTAAEALAQMGALGERNLRAMVSGSDRRAAGAAMEALETLTVGVG